jgi:hypothetical protein
MREREEIMDTLIEDALNAAALRPTVSALKPPCTKHPERRAVMRMDDPLMRFLCAECLAAEPKRVFRPRWLDPATPAWERAALTGAPERDAMYLYRERTIDGAVSTPEWRYLKCLQR